MEDIFKVPCFSGQEFVIFRDDEYGIFLVSLATGKRQLLVECQARSAFCIPIDGQGFDLHFTSIKEEQPGKEYELAHKMTFRPDLIAAMEKCGQMPMIEDNLELIEKQKQENFDQQALLSATKVDDKDRMISDQVRSLKAKEEALAAKEKALED